MKKTNIVIMIVSIFSIILAIILAVNYLNTLKEVSFYDAYDNIQGNYNKDNLEGMTKAFAKKTTIKYGKETKVDENKKTVEAVIKVPDIVKIYETAFEQEKSVSSDNFIEISEHYKKIVEEKLSKNKFEVIENNVVITMVKEDDEWYIVPDEEFIQAIFGTMIDFLKNSFST